MAINQITYADKSNINTSSVPATNKISDSDMNELKSVVNSNANLMGDLTNLSTTTKSSLVGAINEVLGNITITSYGNETVIKFENGLMINTKKEPYSGVSVSTAWGGVYASSNRTPSNYAIPFTEVFSVNGSAGITTGNHWFMFTDGSGTTTTPPNFQLVRGASGTVSGILNIVTIGKWK